MQFYIVMFMFIGLYNHGMVKTKWSLLLYVIKKSLPPF